MREKVSRTGNEGGRSERPGQRTNAYAFLTFMCADFTHRQDRHYTSHRM